MQYLELVNEAIQEAGIDLTRLTVTDFAAPPQEMQRRFKNWMARAWNDLQASRGGWTFLSKRGSGPLNPRIYVTNGSLPSAPVPGDMFQGVDGRAVLTLTRCITLAGDWALGTAKAYLELTDLSTDMQPGELFDRVTVPGGLNAFVYAGRGRWDLTDIAPDIDDLEYQSVYLTDVASGAGDYSFRVRFLEWNLWNNFREGTFTYTSRPAEFTETPDREYDFFPTPDRPYHLHFNYEAKHSRLVNFDDVPALDEQYHMLLVWMTVLSYATWDEKPGIARDAVRNIRFWRNRVENKFLPKLGWGPNLFNAG